MRGIKLGSPYKNRNASLKLTALFSLIIFGVMIPAAFAELSCGDSIITSTILTNDMTNCAGDGIIISASNVVLDCAGHTLSGNYTAGFSGVYVPSGNNIVIKNCTIYGFGDNSSGYGIYISSGNGSTIEYNYISNVYKGIVPGEGANILYNTVFNTSREGIVAISNSVVGHNTIVYADEGIHTGYSDNVSIINNFINNTVDKGLGDPGCGIVIGFSGKGVLVSGNTIINSQDKGIYEVKQSGDVSITGNSISGSGNYGIFIRNTELHTEKIWNNNIYNNSPGQVFADGTIQLSYNNLGNYWGHSSCPLFVAGADSNLVNVVDSYPYNESNGWLLHGPLTCASSPPTNGTNDSSGDVPPGLGAPGAIGPVPGQPQLLAQEQTNQSSQPGQSAQQQSQTEAQQQGTPQSGQPGTQSQTGQQQQQSITQLITSNTQTVIAVVFVVLLVVAAVISWRYSRHEEE